MCSTQSSTSFCSPREGGFRTEGTALAVFKTKLDAVWEALILLFYPCRVGRPEREHLRRWAMQQYCFCATKGGGSAACRPERSSSLAHSRISPHVHVCMCAGVCVRSSRGQCPEKMHLHWTEQETCSVYKRGRIENSGQSRKSKGAAQMHSGKREREQPGER